MAGFKKTDLSINNIDELKKFAEDNYRDPRLTYRNVAITEFSYCGRDCVKVQFIAEDHLVPYAPLDNFFIVNGYDYLCLSPDSPGVLIYSSYSQRYLQDEKPLEGLEAEVEPFMRSIVYIRSEGKEMPLISASKKGDASGVRQSLKEAVDINAKGTASDWGKTALIEAAHRGYSDIVKILIDAGADINATDFYGDTALMLAIDQDNHEIVRMLLNSEADVNAQNITYGTTALMGAARKGNEEVIRMLMTAKADPGIKDWAGNTALTIADRNGRTAIIELLQKAGARE